MADVRQSLEHVPAWVAGAWGAVVASIGRFPGTTLFDDCLSNLFAGEVFQAMTQFGSFLISAAFMALGGAVFARFLQVKTSNRWTLFWSTAVFVSVGAAALP